MKFSGLYEFTGAGLDAFQEAFHGLLEEDAVSLDNPAIAKRIDGTHGFEVIEWVTSRDMAAAIFKSAGKNNINTLFDRPGLWAWLAFVCRDIVYPRRKDGKRKLGEVHRWYPSEASDFQKGQRHLIRMPVLLLSSFGSNADHLLLGPPSVPGEVREQLTSQQDMFHPAFQAAAKTLYFDPTTGKLRRGSGTKKGGSSRRLATVRKQLDVTWDLFALSPEQILEKLPKEFDKFKTAKSA
ncbi:hypothetical protein [Mesorhizobium cantuariense]|uniref:Uncharacterized protein n=1 Tax=Mesorhizobium cantuariense TaxID=1300275 RepID=A0ABV7N294_9HYPH